MAALSANFGGGAVTQAERKNNKKEIELKRRNRKIGFFFAIVHLSGFT
jgi:hypothetical protein